jgi:hypothetical protein
MTGQSPMGCFQVGCIRRNRTEAGVDRSDEFDLDHLRLTPAGASRQSSQSLGGVISVGVARSTHIATLLNAVSSRHDALA